CASSFSATVTASAGDIQSSCLTGDAFSNGATMYGSGRSAGSGVARASPTQANVAPHSARAPAVKLTQRKAGDISSIVSSGDGLASKGPAKRKAKKPRKRFSVLRFLVLLTLMGSAFGAGLAYWGYKQFEKDLPDRWSALTDYRPSRASRVFSSEGELIGEFYLQKRIVLPYDRIPAHVRNAFVAAEDNRFFDHHGIDPLGILRASFANMKAGRVVQGGSTITQQVAKLMLVGNERNLVRKIREAILAHKIENKLSKDQILGIYLNHVYL